MARKPAIPGVDRRQQILEAALEVFAEQGFEGATSKEIAERAEVTHGLIYFYFKNKEGLFFAAFEHQAEIAFAQLDFADEVKRNDPPEIALPRMLGRLLTTLESPRVKWLVRIMMHMAAHNERAEGQLQACRFQMKSRVMGMLASLRLYLDEQIDQGRLRSLDTNILTQILFGGIAAIFRSEFYTDGSLQPTDELRDTIASVFLNGILASPKPPALPDVSNDAPRASPTTLTIPVSSVAG
ncbi:MAG: TetR/AcrR family transcriptional regulator [Ktedonobacterales bacterium]